MPDVKYCPKCNTRYTYDTKECVTCQTTLVDEQPRDFSMFNLKVDVPFAIFAVVFLSFFGRLEGEARSFGLIFLIVGGLTILTFRLIEFSNWLGRR